MTCENCEERCRNNRARGDPGCAGLALTLLLAGEMAIGAIMLSCRPEEDKKEKPNYPIVQTELNNSAQKGIRTYFNKAPNILYLQPDGSYKIQLYQFDTKQEQKSSLAK